MYKDKKVLGLITARGGSKAIPKKNIIELAGKPLIYWSIKAAKDSKYVDRVICSTDNDEIAEISKKYGAEVPFRRPDELAKDDSEDLPVFEHALKWLEENEGFKPDLIIHLRPTSPLRTTDHIDEAIKILADDENADSIRGVSIPEENPFKMWEIEGKYMVPLMRHKGIKDAHNRLRQNLPDVFWQNGAIDIARYNTIMKKHSMTGDNIIGYNMDYKYSVDIDSITSLRVAEIALNEREKGKSEGDRNV
ncbi:MAG: acylneuraminate cytidylyltransferase family protein [Nanoarchaeota archaeon]|nr:acylneuraminate cytidylyltransferase family protein [Nanoarchaeota archaeon]